MNVDQHLLCFSISGLNGICENLFPGEIYNVTVISHLEEAKNISSPKSNPVFFITGE